MMRLCRAFSSFLFLFSLLALVSTFSYTTQDYMDGLSVASTSLEVEAEEDEDERCPQASLIEEELHVCEHFNLTPILPDYLDIRFPDFLNLLPQLSLIDFLKPPSL